MLTRQLLPRLHLVAAGVCLLPGAIIAEQPSRGSQQYAVPADLLRTVRSKNVRRSIERARQYSAAGQHSKALDMLSQLPRNFSESYLRSMLGFEYLELGDAERARTELAESVRLLPNEPIARSNFALALYALGEFDQAFREISQALALAPGNPTSELILQGILAKHPSLPKVGSAQRK